jgi:hypothetical protein
VVALGRHRLECTLGRVFGRVALTLLLAIVLAVVAGSCARSAPQDEIAAICEDFAHLSDTVDLVATPPAGATVGEVRGATEKLDSTIHELERSGAVDDADADAMRAAQEHVLEALEGIGDDELVADLPIALLQPARDLGRFYGPFLERLGCGGSAPA